MSQPVPQFGGDPAIGNSSQPQEKKIAGEGTFQYDPNADQKDYRKEMDTPTPKKLTGTMGQSFTSFDGNN